MRAAKSAPTRADVTNLPLILGAIGAIIGAGGIGALLQSRSLNRRTNAEATKMGVDAEVTLGSGWQELWQSARSEINEVRERLAVVENREAECRARLAQLESHSSPASIERVVASMLATEIAKREVTTP